MDGSTILYPDRLHIPVTLVGAGGIGSTVAPMLVRAGVTKLIIWDPKVVAPVNLQMQNFYAKDLGRPKAVVMARRAKDINPQVEVSYHTRMFTKDDPLDGIVVGAVDLMEEGRLQIYEAVKRSSGVKLLVDGRFTRKGDFIDLFFIDPTSEEEMEHYRHWLFSNSQGHTSLRADSMTAHVPLVLAGLMGEALAQWAYDRRHPWKVTYDISKGIMYPAQL